MPRSIRRKRSSTHKKRPSIRRKRSSYRGKSNIIDALAKRGEQKRIAAVAKATEAAVSAKAAEAAVSAKAAEKNDKAQLLDADSKEIEIYRERVSNWYDVVSDLASTPSEESIKDVSKAFHVLNELQRNRQRLLIKWGTDQQAINKIKEKDESLKFIKEIFEDVKQAVISGSIEKVERCEEIASYYLDFFRELEKELDSKEELEPLKKGSDDLDLYWELLDHLKGTLDFSFKVIVDYHPTNLEELKQRLKVVEDQTKYMREVLTRYILLSRVPASSQPTRELPRSNATASTVLPVLMVL